MNIYINGQLQQLTDESQLNIASALALLLPAENHQRSFAVALNGDFIANSQYKTTIITANDCLDVLFPIVGG